LDDLDPADESRGWRHLDQELVSWALVAHTSAGSSAVGGSATTPSVNTTGASLIVVSVGFSHLPTITDSAGNTWASVGSFAGGQRFYYCANPTTSATHTFSETNTTGVCSFEVLAFSGSTGTIVPDVSTYASAAQPGSATPAVNGELVIASSAFNAAGTAAVGSSFTITDQVAWSSGATTGSAVAWKAQTTATAENPLWSGPAIAASGLVSFPAAPFAVSLQVPANDANIVYSPFNWDVQSSRARAITAARIAGRCSTARSLGWR
jgi:hypothetical protein